MTAKPCAIMTAASLLIAVVSCTQQNVEQRAGTTPQIPLFNGKDLTGWAATGHAKWTVENGAIIGTQGENGAAGDLFTEAEFKDFILTATFRIDWPANSGIWFRYQSDQQAYQADILEYTNPVCYTGSLYCMGKQFIALNENKDLVKKDSWNTLRVRAEGDHIQIRLNGQQVADVHDDSSGRGRIGLQVHPGDAYTHMKITVREITIQPLESK